MKKQLKNSSDIFNVRQPRMPWHMVLFIFFNLSLYIYTPPHRNAAFAKHSKKMDRELDFVNDRDLSGSRFKELDIGPFNSFTPSQASAQLVSFFVPANETYNWSKSHIDLDLTFPASAGYSNYLHMGRNQIIQSLTLQYDGNNFPVNVQDCRLITCTTLPQLSAKEYRGRPIAQTAGSIAQLAGVGRCELFQPIKKPSGFQTSNMIGSIFTSSVTVAAAANNTYGAAGTLCGHVNGISAYSTGNIIGLGRAIATCNGMQILGSTVAGAAVAIGQHAGYLGGYPFISSVVAAIDAANGLGAPVVPPVPCGTVLGNPAFSTGEVLTAAGGVVIAKVNINGVVCDIVSNGIAAAVDGSPGFARSNQAYIANTSNDVMAPGGYSVSIDQTANGATALPEPSSGPDSVCTAIGSGVNQQFAIRLRLNLSDYRNTLFAVDRTMCWPRNANLKVTFAPTQYWGYSLPAATISPALTGCTFLQSVPTVGLCVLRLAVEKSPDIRVAAEVMTRSGYSLRFPQISTTGFSLQQTSTGFYSVNLDSSMGHSILRIYTVVLRNDLQGVAWMNQSNSINRGVGGAAGVNAGVLVPNQYSTFQSYLGTELLQDQQLLPAQCDDYRFLRKMLDGCAITSQDDFSNFSFFVDNFTNATPSYTWDASNCDMGGKPLKDAEGRDIQYNYRIQLTGNTGVSSQVYMIIVAQNTITLSDMGVMIGAAASR